MNSKLDLKLIDIKLLTNNGSKVSFTKKLIHHPELLDPKIIKTYSFYPYFSKDVYYSYEKMKKLSYQRIYNLFFVRSEFQKKIKFYSNAKYKRINYPPTLIDLKTADKNVIEKYKTEVAYKNITTMLKLFFPTIYPFTNNVSESYTLVKNESTNYDMSPFKKKFSYLKLNDKIYTVSNVVWLNDLLNNPTYQLEKGEGEELDNENKDDDSFVGLLNIVYDYLSWGEGEKERIKEKIEVTKNNLINKAKSFDKIGILNEIEGYLQVIKSNSLSLIGENDTQAKAKAEEDDCGLPNEPIVKQKCKILKELRKMIMDIDDTNVILQDDKYYLVPFISNKNIEDLSGFKKIIDHFLYNLSNSNRDEVKAETVKDLNDNAPSLEIFKNDEIIKKLLKAIRDSTRVVESDLTPYENNERPKDHEKDENETYDEVILKFLFEYRKNKFSIEAYDGGQQLATNYAYKDDLDKLKSKINNDFLIKQNEKGDIIEDWMKKYHNQIYGNNGIDISSLSFFVKKKAKDTIEQESFQHMFIEEEIRFKSDFIYTDEINYEELNYPVFFTISNKSKGEKYLNITNFFLHKWTGRFKTKILFLRCKVTKNNKYQLYSFENDIITKNILNILYNLTLNPDKFLEITDSKKITYIAEKNLLNDFELPPNENGTDVKTIISEYCKDIVNTFFSQNKSNNYNINKIGDGEVYIECSKEEFFKRAAIMNNDIKISQIMNNENITLERVQLRNEQIINYYETNLPILKQYITQSYSRRDLNGINPNISDTLQPMRFEIANKDFAEWIELTKKEIKDIRLLKRFENDYLKCQGNRPSFCTRIYVNDETKWDEKRFEKFLKVKEKYKKFMNNNMVSSNKKLQKMIDDYGNNNDNNYIFVDFVKRIYESAIVNNEAIPQIELPDEEINYIDLLNIGYNEIKNQSRNLPEITIDVQMDLIEGEITKKNVKKIKCPFCDEKLTEDALKLFFNKDSVKIWKVDNYPFVVLNEQTNELEEKQKKEKIIESKKIEQKIPTQKQSIPNKLPDKVPSNVEKQLAPPIKAGMNIMKKNIKLKPQRQLRGKKKFKRSMKITKRNNKKNKTIKK